MDAVAIPGGRDVRATLDGDRDANAAVVACPPHPRYGGSRTDGRLRAVSDALVERGIACLRFDYGPWDQGRGERRDAGNALAWAVERFDRVGLFGYSFGAGVAALATVESDPGPAALSLLAPSATVGERDVATALDRVECPTQVVYGERDDTVDWGPVVERARDRGLTIESLRADHHFVGQTGRVGEIIAAWFAGVL